MDPFRALSPDFEPASPLSADPAKPPQQELDYLIDGDSEISELWRVSKSEFISNFA
jgi:hypothetical protein